MHDTRRTHDSPGIPGLTRWRMLASRCLWRDPLRNRHPGSHPHGCLHAGDDASTRVAHRGVVGADRRCHLDSTNPQRVPQCGLAGHGSGRPQRRASGQYCRLCRRGRAGQRRRWTPLYGLSTGSGVLRRSPQPRAPLSLALDRYASTGRGDRTACGCPDHMDGFRYHIATGNRA